jgi:predicted DNA-binding transcriptional regulator YafY
LVSKAGVWYLIARSDGEFRSFRVERVASAQTLPERFERPSDFDLERYWAESSGRFAEASRTADCVVKFRAENDALDRVTYYWPAEIVSTDARESIVRVTFPGREVAVFQAVAWSDVATLIEPDELREAIARRARRALERHALR